MRRDPQYNRRWVFLSLAAAAYAPGAYANGDCDPRDGGFFAWIKCRGSDGGYERRLDALRAERSALRSAVSARRRTLRRLDVQIVSSRRALDRLQSELNALRRQCRDLLEQLEELRAQREINQLAVFNAQRDIAELAQRAARFRQLRPDPRRNDSEWRTYDRLLESGGALVSIATILLNPTLRVAIAEAGSLVLDLVIQQLAPDPWATAASVGLLVIGLRDLFRALMVRRR